MASEVISKTDARSSDDMFDDDFASRPGIRWTAVPVLKQLASLKLTVVLFALAIVLVFFGTLAQAQLPINDVVRDFFRSPFVWINVRLLFPPSFFPNLEITRDFYLPYPGGLSIGLAMAVNLLAAHAVRFKVQASGGRLIAGLCVIALGLVVTTIVILTGMGSQGVQEFYLPWDKVWQLLLACMVGLCGAMVYGALSLRPNEITMRWGMLVAAAALGGLVLWLVVSPQGSPLSDPSMRILWQLAKGTAAGLVLLTGCLLAFKRRAGVVLIHVGVGLMMVNELLVGFYAHESHMSIGEGEAVNFAFELDHVELAIVDPSGADVDVEVVVPGELLIEGEKVSDDLLPIDIELVEYQENSRLVEGVSENNQATAGLGLRYYVVAAHRFTGTDSEVDMPSAYVRLTDRSDGEALGTFLVTTHLTGANIIEAGGTSYEVSLRFRRIYKPYSIYLLDVHKIDHEGSNMARSYSSDIHLINPETEEDIDDISTWMNNPFRYNGEAFYQSNFSVDPRTGAESTGLQIVGNDNWMIPYIGCMIVAVGLLAHFSLTLRRFLSRSNALRQTSNTSILESFASVRILLPASILLLLGCLVASQAISKSPTKGEIDLESFGRIPILHAGRVKPFDAFARDLLRIVSKKATFRIVYGNEGEGSADAKEKTSGPMPAALWLLDLIADPEVGRSHRVVRIETLELVNELGLESRPLKWRYSLEELGGENRQKIRDHAEAAINKDKLDRSNLDRKWMDLHQRLFRIDVILASTGTPHIRWEDPEQFRSEYLRAVLHGQKIDANSPPLFIPISREGEDAEEETWETLYSAYLEAFLQRGLGEAEINKATLLWVEIILAYQEGDAEEFNKQVNQYHAFLERNAPDGTDLAKVKFESYFNSFNPFTIAEVFYIIVFVLTALSWLTASLLETRPDEKNVWRIIFGSRAIYATAVALILATFVLHTYALASRMYISGRPPVTNLYSSAVFIGWGLIIGAMIMEAFFRRGIAMVVAAGMGFGTLWIADYLALGGDTLPVLLAVLDTQFWLATHVTCITFGYAVTYLAGMLGIAYVLGGVLTRAMDAELRKELSKMIYGALCFAIFFSFVGTVLGGLWADDSWGRFWGWDTKENGALIIVLWNALVLHARWGGMVRERGFAVLAVGGNIAVTWSWFGVNELGVGLHNYGFTEGTLLRLAIACLIFIAIIVIGCLPTKNWRGFAKPDPPASGR